MDALLRLDITQRFPQYPFASDRLDYLALSVQACTIGTLMHAILAQASFFGTAGEVEQSTADDLLLALQLAPVGVAAWVVAGAAYAACVARSARARALHTAAATRVKAKTARAAAAAANMEAAAAKAAAAAATKVLTAAEKGGIALAATTKAATAGARARAQERRSAKGELLARTRTGPAGGKLERH